MKVEAKILATTDHQKHNHETEACTPFCTCSCCASSAYFPLVKIFTPIGASSSQNFPLFNIAFNAEAHYSIWQPPKL